MAKLFEEDALRCTDKRMGISREVMGNLKGVKYLEFLGCFRVKECGVCREVMGNLKGVK